MRLLAKNSDAASLMVGIAPPFARACATCSPPASSRSGDRHRVESPRTSEAVEYLGRRALAGSDGPVDRTVRHGRGLGTGPVHAAEGLSKQVAVARQNSRRKVRQ